MVGKIGTLASRIMRLASILDPIAAIASGVGPMNLIPASPHRFGKAGVF